MSENIIYLVPMISVMAFSLIERFVFNRQTLDAKTRPIFFIVLINLLVSLVFSASLLFPFVILVAPLQFFTIAELNIPEFLIIILSILIIDFVYYVTHRLHHRIIPNAFISAHEKFCFWTVPPDNICFYSNLLNRLNRFRIIINKILLVAVYVNHKRFCAFL